MYKRQILCNIIGQWVEDGEYPNDEKALEKIVKGICFDLSLIHIYDENLLIELGGEFSVCFGLWHGQYKAVE